MFFYRGSSRVSVMMSFSRDSNRELRVREIATNAEHRVPLGFGHVFLTGGKLHDAFETSIIRLRKTVQLPGKPVLNYYYSKEPLFTVKWVSMDNHESHCPLQSILKLPGKS